MSAICIFFFLMIRRPPISTRTDTLFPYTTLFRSHHLGEAAAGHDLAAATHHLYRHVEPCRAAVYSSGQEAADEVVGLQRGRQHREGAAGIGHRRRHMLHDEVEELPHVLALLLQIGNRPALLGRGEERREVELSVGSLQRDEEVEDL